jgi:hypothetical protein
MTMGRQQSFSNQYILPNLQIKNHPLFAIFNPNIGLAFMKIAL